MFFPEMVERLIVCNMPHPSGLMRELAQNPEQQANSQYARDFQKEGAHHRLSAELLARWVDDPAAREKYVEAFKRSDFEAMLNYYKANYPREPYELDLSPVNKVKCPVLIIYGLQDKHLLPAALNGTWEWLEQELTLVTVPEAGHYVATRCGRGRVSHDEDVVKPLKGLSKNNDFYRRANPIVIAISPA